MLKYEDEVVSHSNCCAIVVSVIVFTSSVISVSFKELQLNFLYSFSGPLHLGIFQTKPHLLLMERFVLY